MLPLSLKVNSQGNYFLRAPHNVRLPSATQHIFAPERPPLGTHTYRLQIVKERLADPHFFASFAAVFRSRGAHYTAQNKTVKHFCKKSYEEQKQNIKQLLTPSP